MFAGFQQGADLGRAVASMDVLFNPSVTETFGNVTLEAMAAALPVVAAIATGSQSLVEDAVTGRLVRAGAIDGFAAALEAYCGDPERRRAAGRAGCEASRRYGWDEVNQALVDGYWRVIRQRQNGGRGPPRARCPERRFAVWALAFVSRHPHRRASALRIARLVVDRLKAVAGEQAAILLRIEAWRGKAARPATRRCFRLPRARW